MSSNGILYVVALPIGNPEDITLRAQRILSKVDVVAAEDTRTFQLFASQLDIATTKVVAYHEHNEHASSEGLIKLLEDGMKIALVSDAGTPNISDPGRLLVSRALKANITVTAIPGPSALALALSLCPIGGNSHFFGAFPPVKTKGRRELFKQIQGVSERLVFFEAPHRSFLFDILAKDLFFPLCLGSL